MLVLPELIAKMLLLLTIPFVLQRIDVLRYVEYLNKTTEVLLKKIINRNHEKCQAKDADLLAT